MNKMLKKCPNCGANIEHNYNHKCPYCRTYLHMTDEQIKTIKNCDIRVDKINIDIDHITYSYIVKVYCWSTPKAFYIEEFNENKYVISGDDIGKRLCFMFRLSIESVYCDIDHLPEIIYHSIPETVLNGYNEEKIINECMEFFKSL